MSIIKIKQQIFNQNISNTVQGIQKIEHKSEAQPITGTENYTLFF